MYQDFYVYAHFDKDGQCRYVGKGRANRAWTFCQRSKRWRAIFDGFKPIVKLLENDLDEITAFEKECFYVSKFLSEGCDLANIAAGGPGGNSWDQRATEILSEMRRGKGYWRGKSRTELMKKLKEIQMEKCPKPWLGKKRDPELIKKLAQASHTPEINAKREQVKKLGTYGWTEERRKKLSEWAKNRIMTEEHKQNISKAKKGCESWAKGKPKSEETRRKMSEAAKGKRHSQEIIDKIKESKKRNGNKTSKAKAVRCLNTGEVFRCASDAANTLTGGIGEKVIQQCCVGKKPSYKGFKFEYAQSTLPTD